jgi:hypothetical protein
MQELNVESEKRRALTYFIISCLGCIVTFAIIMMVVSKYFPLSDKEIFYFICIEGLVAGYLHYMGYKKHKKLLDAIQV